MGKWYGPGGDEERGGGRTAPTGNTVNPPCPNGILLSDPNAPFNGTKMKDSMGRLWGCPSITKDPGTTTGDEQTQPKSDGSGTGAPGATGMWSMSPGLTGLYDSLLGRANDVLGMPLGYDQTAQNYMFGTGFDALRGNEAANRNTIMGGLNNLGMTNTGAGVGMLNQNAWNTSQGISNLMRDLFVKNEEQKKTDLLNNTQLAQSLFGTGMGAEQATEVINAARRGEASDFWRTLLAYLSILRG